MHHTERRVNGLLGNMTYQLKHVETNTSQMHMSELQEI